MKTECLTWRTAHDSLSFTVIALSRAIKVIRPNEEGGRLIYFDGKVQIQPHSLTSDLPSFMGLSYISVVDKLILTPTGRNGTFRTL